MIGTPGSICGNARQPHETAPNGPVSDYCMAPVGHHGAHIYSARDDEPVADDGFCPATHGQQGDDAELYCERNEGHQGEHRAAVDIPSSTLQRLILWT